MPKKLGPMDVYRLLPGDNCGDCGVKTCMGFASLLLERRKGVEDCPILSEPEYEENEEKLIELLTPPVRPITIGAGAHAFEMGNEEVMFRHEKKWYSPAPIIIDVDDEMDDDLIAERVEWIYNYSRIKIGEELSFDGIAVRSKSGDPKRFKKAVEIVKENSEYPLVLCSYDPKVLEAGLEVLDDGNPLLYAANTDNWKGVSDLAIDCGCPMTISSSDMDEMVEISTRVLNRGVGDDQIVLDPVTDPIDLKETIGRITLIRRAAVEDGFEPLRFPILGVPATAWMVEEDENEASFMEGTIACSLLLHKADALIFHSTDIWSLMPAIVMRQDIYQDPQNPASVEPKLNEVGQPDEGSPVLITCNFALTYYTVEGDVSDIDCYIFPVDTDGTSVASAVAGDLMTSDDVVDAIENHIKDKVSHNTVIIPGLAAVLSGQAEVDSGWRVMVGPKDSSGIPEFLDENWPPED